MRLLAIAGVLPAHDIVESERAHRLEYLGFLGMYGRVVLMHGRLHGKQRHDLEQVILNDIAQTSRGFIESATLLDSELLGQGNLHALYVRSEEHTSELQSLMRISYAVFCLK